MSDRSTPLRSRAFQDRLRSSLDELTAIETRDTWPASIHSQVVRLDAESPYPVEVLSGADEPIMYGVASASIPPGRWVIAAQATHDAEVTTGVGVDTFTVWSEFTFDGERIRMDRSELKLESFSLIVGDTHHLMFSDVFTEGGVMSVGVAATKTNATDTMDWFLRSFSVVAFPG